MWFLEIKCTAFLAVCILNPEPSPALKRDYLTRIECDRALIEIAKSWRPAGAWKMNCVQR